MSTGRVPNAPATVRGAFAVFGLGAFLAFFGALKPANAAQLVDCPPGTFYKEATIGYERATWCARKDGSREGPSIVWMDAKRKREEGSFTRDERTGLWRTWHSNGKLESQGVLSKGKRTGTWKTWFDNGSLEQVATYDDGVPDGPWVTYYRNGNKAEAGRMESGSHIGTWTAWYENGRKMREGAFKPIARGRGESESTTWQDGRWTYWYENGRKQKEGVYRWGMREGAWSEWDENGRVRVRRYTAGFSDD